MAEEDGVGTRVAALRKGHGWSGRELTRRAQVSYGLLTKVESGAARRRRLRVASAATAVITALTIAIVIPLSLLPGSAAADEHHQRSLYASARPASRRGTIMIDPQVGETFAPAPAPAAPVLTAQQAWARFMRHLDNAHTIIPSDVHVQLGLFTLPVGPNGPGGTETYIAHNELAYGYSSPSGCLTLNPKLQEPPNARCISWDFLNADTGAQIDSTYQKVGHWHWHWLYNPKGL